MAYANDETTPVRAVVDRLVRQGVAYGAVPLNEGQQQLVRRRLPLLVTVQIFDFRAESDVIEQACEAEGLRGFFVDSDVENALDGLVSRYGVQLTSRAFENLGRAFQQTGVAAADFGHAVEAMSQGFEYPAWIKKGTWVQDKKTQCRGRIEFIRSHDVTIYGHADDDPLGRPPLITKIPKGDLSEVFEPCDEPIPRLSRWSLIDD